MPVVRDTVVDPAGHPLRFQSVTVHLIAAATGRDGPLYDGIGDRTIIGTWTPQTDETGMWSATLEANEGREPANSYYVYKPTPNAEPQTFDVPAAGGPFWVGDLLTDPPAGLPTMLSGLLAAEIENRVASVNAEQTRALAAEATKLAKAANLSDVDDPDAARDNIGAQALIAPGTYVLGAGRLTVSPTAPADPAVNDLWIDTSLIP